MAELTTEDLRFTRRETADLFAHSYGTPIDDDLVTAIDERLEGWGASLQLVVRITAVASTGRGADVRSRPVGPLGPAL